MKCKNDAKSLFAELSNRGIYEDRWGKCEMHIVDEVSMAGTSLLGRHSVQIEKILLLANQNLAFGGKSTILMGDVVGQLDPYGGGALHDRSLDRVLGSAAKKLTMPTAKTLRSFEIYGGRLLRQFKNVVVLSKIMRQGKDADPRLVRFLRNMRVGQNDWQDVQWMNSATMQLGSHSQDTQDSYKKHRAIFPQWKKMNGEDMADAYNTKRSCELGTVLHHIPANHVAPGGMNAKKFSSAQDSLFMGIPADPGWVGVGSNVMLTNNRWPEANLANGSFGLVLELVWHPDTADDQPPDVLLIQWDSNYKGPSYEYTTPAGESLERVAPLAKLRMKHDTIDGVFRIGFPIKLSWAVSVGKSRDCH
jgi:hypothetical protein